MSTINYDVKWAVYGAFSPSLKNYNVKNVAAKLQQILDQGTTSVQMGNGIFGDPCPGIHKYWSACIQVNGSRYLFAGKEDEVVNLLTLPNPEGEVGLQVMNLTAQMVPGGWPTPANDFLFSACSINIINRANTSYPPTTAISQWVSVDFYFATSNSMEQQLSQLIKIGDSPITVNLKSQQQGNYIIPVIGLFNVSRDLTGNPGLIRPNTPYYLYAQVRSATNSQQLTGFFTPNTFTPKLP